LLIKNLNWRKEKMKMVIMAVIFCFLFIGAAKAQKFTAEQSTQILLNGYQYYDDGQLANAKKVSNLILESDPANSNGLSLKLLSEKKLLPEDKAATALTAKYYFIQRLNNVSADTAKLEVKNVDGLRKALTDWQKFYTPEVYNSEVHNAEVCVANIEGISDNLAPIREDPGSYVFGSKEKKSILQQLQKNKDFWHKTPKTTSIATNNLVVIGQSFHKTGNCEQAIGVFNLVSNIDSINADALINKALILSDWKLKKSNMLHLTKAYPYGDKLEKILVLSNLIASYPVTFSREKLAYQGLDTIQYLLGIWVEHEKKNGLNSLELQKTAIHVKALLESQSVLANLISGGEVSKTPTGFSVKKGNTITNMSFASIEEKISTATALFSKHTPICKNPPASYTEAEKKISWKQIHANLRKIINQKSGT
jgi:hypothetical protein